LKFLVPERVYAELNKGMGEAKPSRMIKFISKLNAWAELAPSCPVPFSSFDEPEYDCLNSRYSAEERWVYSLGFFLDIPHIKALAKAWRVPRNTEDLSVVAQQCIAFLQRQESDPGSFCQFFNQVDLYRKPARLLQVNQLVAQINGVKPANSFVDKAVAEVEQGHYKTFLADKIASALPGEQVAQVAANARLFTVALAQAAGLNTPRVQKPWAVPWWPTILAWCMAGLIWGSWVWLLKKCWPWVAT